MPAKIANKPTIFLGLALYLNAWFELDGERNATIYEPIKRSDCFAYANDYEFDEMQKDDLWFYVSAMDRQYLKWKKSKEPPPPKEGKGKQKRRGRP